MLKKLFVIPAICCLITLLLVACGTTSSSAPAGHNEVHMTANTFAQTSITLKKGESITLVDDTFVPHTIKNGTWENNVAKAAREPGAPEVNDVQVNSNGTASIGPFTTAGTFKLYCTIHPGMNLTVIVQ